MLIAINNGIYKGWNICSLKNKNSLTFSVVVFYQFLKIYLRSCKRNNECHDLHATTCMQVLDPSVYFSWLHEMDSGLQTASKHSLSTFTFESHKTLNSRLHTFSQRQDTLEGSEFRFPSGEAFLPHLCLSSECLVEC